MPADLWQRWRLAALGLAAVTLGVGAQVDWLLRGEAIGALLVVPVVALAMGLKDVRGSLRSVAVIAGVVVVVMAALEVARVAFPNAPVAATQVSIDSGNKTVQLPTAVDEFEVDTTATLASGGSQAHGVVTLVLERGGHQQRVTSEFTHSAPRQRAGRSTLAATGFKVQQITRDRVSLSGDGPMSVSLASSSGAVMPTVEVAIRSIPLWSRMMPFVMAFAVFVALILQAVAAKRGVKTFVVAGVGVGAVLGPYLQYNFNPYSIGSTTVGALIVAVVIGGGAGVMACLVFERLVEKASA